MLPLKKIIQGFKWCILKHIHVQMWSFFVCRDLNVGPLDPPLHSAAPVQILSCNIHSRWEQSDVD